MKKILLTSSLYDTKEIVSEFLEDSKSRDIFFIPTASLVEEYRAYVDGAKSTFEELGYNVIELEISSATNQEAKEIISSAEILYVSGGNSFYLLQEMKKKHLDTLIKEKVESGMFYIGESAGSIVASKNIEYSEVMDNKSAAKSLDEFTGLSLVDFYVVPHYKEQPFVESADLLIEKYKDKLNLVKINNKQAIIVEDSGLFIK